ncbi:MAG TPA: N(4)-(beta-N-acetylglucosaminyl)-L-asparaginase [Pirellulaceae bacterium]
MASSPMTRRDVLLSGSVLTFSGALTATADEPGPFLDGKRPLAIATWNFGQMAVDRALKVLEEGGSTLDAVEQGIRNVEASGGTSVGLSGKPNAAGFVQQDACIMHGPGHHAGSVAGLEGIKHPISAARRVMQDTRHVMLVGDGARAFAIKCGLEHLPIDTHEAQAATWWEQVQLPMKDRPFRTPSDGYPQPVGPAQDDHDTVTLLVLSEDGTISGGCSTSGLADKFPGRVGDSPILGSGLYVDNEVGAAGGTGIGENIMRYSASLLIVEEMRRGATPTEACHAVIRRIMKSENSAQSLEIFFIALDRHGRCGAAGTGEFPHAIAYPGYSQVVTSPPVT